MNKDEWYKFVMHRTGLASLTPEQEAYYEEMRLDQYDVESAIEMADDQYLVTSQGTLHYKRSTGELTLTAGDQKITFTEMNSWHVLRFCHKELD